MLMQTLNRSPRKLHSHDLRTPPVSLLHSRKKRTLSLSRSCADRERADCCGLYAKRQLMVPATIVATYSRDYIYIYIYIQLLVI